MQWSISCCCNREEAINMAEGCYVYTISVAGTVQSLFRSSLDSFQKIPPKCSNILSGLRSKDAGWTVKTQSATTLPVCCSSCCKEEREQFTVPFCWQQQENLVRGTVIFWYLLGQFIFFLSRRQKSLTKLWGTYSLESQLLIIRTESWTLNLMQPKVSEANTVILKAVGCFQTQDC